MQGVELLCVFLKKPVYPQLIHDIIDIASVLWFEKKCIPYTNFEHFMQ